MHVITVTHFQQSDGQGLLVAWSGGGLYKQEIAATSLYHENRAPIAMVAASESVTTVGTTVTLSGAGSYDPDTSPHASMLYTWTCRSWPAGSEEPAATDVSGDWMQAEFAPAFPGEYVWQLTVDDGEDVAHEAVTVTAEAQAIAVTVTVPATVSEGDGSVRGSVDLNRALFAGESVVVSLATSNPAKTTSE